jgi:ABC-type multidrug transport system permease subunit
MKPEQYNPKAREAFGKSLVDVGNGIFKGITLLFTIVPMTYLLKGALNNQNSEAMLSGFRVFLVSPAYVIFLILFAGSFSLAYYFRKEGLRHIHECENSTKT